MNQLLSLARAEPGSSRVRVAEPVDLVNLARNVTTEWVPRALERRIDLGFESPLASARIEGDVFLLGEMLNNLLDNAVRYTQPGGQVTVREENATAALEVMSRFAANPRWLIYLPPTMSPSETSREPPRVEWSLPAPSMVTGKVFHLAVHSSFQGSLPRPPNGLTLPRWPQPVAHFTLLGRQA